MTPRRLIGSFLQSTRILILLRPRLAVHGRYNTCFRVTDAETIIVRVVHSARDVKRLQFDDNGTP